jgi:NAD(P)-dependent dehydrogenase (short-subunit alcohol dehydrogenase family)/acyl carrier protein
VSTTIATPANGYLAKEIREVFAEVTRYPLEILTPDASLEEDLGIDSVKLGEVFAVLREKYSLAEDIGIPREQLRTIASISEALEAHLKTNQPPAPAPVLNGTSPRHEQPRQNGDFRKEVQGIFASVTRYPLDVLDLDASLEEDLGIDSVKLGEVFAVMREQYGLPEKMDLSRDQIRTIAGISDALEVYTRAALAPSAPLHVSNGHRGAASSAPAPLSLDEISRSVRQVFAEVTRYPVDILDLNASLEEDLGIDSVKLGEIFAVLRERYSLAEDAQIPRENLKTIGGISEALRVHLQGVANEIKPELDLTLNVQVKPWADVMADVKVDVKTPVNGNGVHRNGNGTGHSSAVVDNSFAGLTPQRKPFEGKIALITGSGRAMGKDLAIYLAELGASVVVNSFHSRAQGEETVAEIKAAGGKAVHAWGSVANPEHVKSIFEVADKTFGGLDFLVCNASNGLLAPLEELLPEHWEKAFRTNVIGLHQCSLRGLELMKKRGGGKIITMSSPAAHDYVDYFGCMGAVKAAVENLTKSMAVEFAPYNVQVNCVSPGPVYGELLDKWPESNRLTKEFEKATLYHRMCESRDVSHFIAYLLSDPVQLFTGSVLVMDAGVSVKWPGHRSSLG